MFDCAFAALAASCALAVGRIQDENLFLALNFLSSPSRA